MKINILISKNSWANSYKIEIKKKKKNFLKILVLTTITKKLKKALI